LEKYTIQRSPFVVPTHDGKYIAEHFGNASIAAPMSIARMIAPPHWAEPFQQPEFDEYTLILKGKKQFKFIDETVVLTAGESIKITKGTPIQYSNPFDEEVEYISVCMPAFSVDTVHRLL